MTSPPAIWRDLVITGALVPETASRGPSGDIRAFDVRTGAQVWRFHTVPHAGEAGNETWEPGSWRDRTGANVWSIMSVDVERGLVFLPTRLRRLGLLRRRPEGRQPLRELDRRARRGDRNATLASAARASRHLGLRPRVAARARDDPSRRPRDPRRRADDEERLDVRARPSHRRAALSDRGASDAVEPRAGRAGVAHAAVSGRSPHRSCGTPRSPPPISPTSRPSRARSARTSSGRLGWSGGAYVPPDTIAGVWFPGTLGGATWSGASIDPQLGYAFVNVNEVGAVGAMRRKPSGATAPEWERWSPWGIYARFWDPNDLPCQRPPWGKLIAVNLATGDFAWTVTLGVNDSLLARGVPKTGAPNLGGSIATAGGLVFIGSTNDRRFRAFDSRTGAELWVDAARGERARHADHLSWRAIGQAVRRHRRGRWRCVRSRPGGRRRGVRTSRRARR